MTARTYALIDSWHVVERAGRDGDVTYCGRTVNRNEGTTADTLPLGEKSCETCLRLAMAAETERDPEGVDMPSETGAA
ncbi:MAG TPA: hypothetical protein VFR93_02230 [Candidatus Limnocylindrales bacterium]|nr:hypothetical protein [Candidatus Limnocylindrales bacterium]